MTLGCGDITVNNYALFYLCCWGLCTVMSVLLMTMPVMYFLWQCTLLLSIALTPTIT